MSGSGDGAPLGGAPLPAGEASSGRPRRSTVIALTSIAALAGALTFVSVYSWWVYANHDRTAWIDDPVVEEVAMPACAAMLRDIAEEATQISSAQTPSDAATGMRAQAAAVKDMIEAVEGVGERRLDNDRPTRAWLGDWDRIAATRLVAADAIELGRLPEEAQLTDEEGRLLALRINEAPLFFECDVPETLLTTPRPPHRDG